MPSRSPHEIELLISKIVESQHFWNIFTLENRDRVKKSDAGKEVLEVLD